ncbi:hypothetical protein [Microbispora sp. KK1-11]|uniref:hypothetical protein n=1 Tax=Microbispora sp. KK1-11 TaxID=2053005 RepID=UPI00115A085E|nr:hypothetical protein [Microbispora sp. KK1-11]TQS30210.1 hypothetical protein FLW16_07645 [Microbispora sp. KK1-11]
MCGYPVLAAASLSLLLMPLPRSAFLESAAFTAAFLEPSALASGLFHAPALASALFEPSAFTAAFLEPSALASAFFHAPALASAFLEPSALASAFFHAPALASAFLESAAFTAAFLEPSALASAFFHAPALASALFEPSALASAFFHAPALASALFEPSAFTAAFLESAPFTAAFATVVAVRPVALTATAPASGAGLRRVLHDLCGAAGRIDRLRLHRHRDDEGRRRDRASSQCFLEHEYHSVDSVTVAGKHPDARSANRSIEPWIQTLILTLEVTKGPVTQQCANNRLSQQKTNVIGGVVGPFPRADNSFTRVAGFLPHH